MRKIFLGPPGSGKGTYSKRISPIRNIPHISTGDLLRESIKNKTELGIKAKEYMEKGELVPDELVIETLRRRIIQKDCEEGFILDGFPRTINQAKILKNITQIDLVLNLILPEDILIEKICSRRICKNCGDIYNFSNVDRKGIKMPAMLPKKEGKCDKCEGELFQREDDNREVVASRLRVYEEQTKPLIEFYQKEKILQNIEIKGSTEEMIEKLIELLKKMEKNKNFDSLQTPDRNSFKHKKIINTMKKERTLVLIKPDGIVKSLVGNIITAISETKLKIVAAKVVNVQRGLAEQHYSELKLKKPEVFEAVLDYIMGKHHNTPRVIALIYEGEDAINKIREICGETNPEKAHPISLRGKYGRINSSTGVMENVVHTSDSSESAKKEIALWFKEEEIARGE